MMEIFTNIDVRCFYLIYKSCANPIFNVLMPWVTDLASGEFLVPLALLLIALRKKEYRIAALLLLAGLTLSYYSVTLLKEWVARPRPFMALPDVLNLAHEKNFSFPSNHATNAFMAAFILSSVFRARSILFILAAAVGFSRVYLAAHYPSDVLTGAALGLAIGYFLVLITKRYLNKASDACCKTSP